MKQRIYLFILLSVTAVISSAQTVGEAMYIYRNDGEFNAFFRDEVQSIEFSYEDADGKTCEKIVTQIINTADSVYRIPLAAIDSIGFVQPKTIVSEDVFPLTADHAPYITQTGELSFSMSTSAPANLRPYVGNIVVATADCSSFPYGIIAKVEGVELTGDSYYYTCSQAYLDDVFDQLVTYQSGLSENEASSFAKGFDLQRASLTASLWNESWTKTIEGGGTTTTLSVSDFATATVTVRKTLTTPFYFQLQLQNTIKTGIDFNAQSSASISKELQIGKTMTAGKITVPYTMGLLWLEPKLSLFGYFDEKGKVELNYAGHINRTDKLSFTYMQKEWTFSHVPVTDVGTDVAKLSMEGSAEIGLKSQIDFSLCGRQAGFGMNAQVGLKEYINFVFDATRLSDGGLYESMRDSYCRTTIPWSVSVHANANIFSRYDAGHSDSGPATYSYTFSPAREPQWGEDRYIFPVFENVSAKRQKGDQTKADAKSSVLRTPLLPLQLGFSVLDQDGNVINLQYDSRTYDAGNLFETFTTELTGLQSGEKYKVRPTIKMMGYDIAALPIVEIEEDCEISCPDSNHPHWIDLGLRSGTQWRCCNEGASTPEAYGGYYTFGQVASAPSLMQMLELQDYCTSEWTTLNGVSGRKFTGPNSNSIFLPAAGRLTGRGFQHVGVGGFYWSSTPIDSGDIAYGPDFNAYSAFLNYWDWSTWGHSVRPVR